MNWNVFLTDLVSWLQGNGAENLMPVLIPIRFLMLQLRAEPFAHGYSRRWFTSIPKLDNAAPSLKFHFRTFLTNTGCNPKIII